MARIFTSEMDEDGDQRPSDDLMINEEEYDEGEFSGSEFQYTDSDFEDPPSYVDDIKDSDLLADILKDQPEENNEVDNIVVVDGIPCVGADRLSKLQTVVKKIFTKAGKIKIEHFALTSDGGSSGFVFLEYEHPQNAIEAVATLDGYKLDKQHTLLVNTFVDLKKFLNVDPENFETPQEKPYVDHGNLQSWLLDEDAFDQYTVVEGKFNKVSIMLNSRPEPSLLESRMRWTETYTKWSPRGSFMLTLHREGVAVWGGAKMERIQRVAHPGVAFVDFSPNENYLVTFSAAQPPSQQGGHKGSRTKEEPDIRIWETRTGIQKRSFMSERLTSEQQQTNLQSTVASGMIVWPAFKWSHDGKYFARMSGDGVLSIYETPSFGLLDKKSIKVTGMRDFSWSPCENIIAFYVGENKDVPARVTLLSIPSRNEIRVKNLFNVASCKIHWQKSGEYLCLNVNRYTKMRRDEFNVPKYAGVYHNFEIFHMREKQIPVDSVELKDTCVNFAWEPIGSKFAIVHGEGPQDYSISFYDVKAGQSPVLVKTYERMKANNIYWSPAGQFVVLSGLCFDGRLEFIDTSDFTTMGAENHYTCSEIDWDPTGRYLMTAVTQKDNDSYWIWSFQGKILKRIKCELLKQFVWRPRHPSLLTKKHIKELKKNMKRYATEFEAIDVMRSSKASQELIDRRRRLYREFNKYREERVRTFESEMDDRKKLRITEDGKEENDNLGNEDLAEEVVVVLLKDESNIEDVEE